MVERPEFEIGGIPHRLRHLSAYQQFHLWRALAPVLPAVVAVDAGAFRDHASVMAAAAAVADVGDETLAKAFDAAAGAAERLIEGAWTDAARAIPLPEMISLVVAVVAENLAAFLQMPHPDFTPTPSPWTYKPVSMPDDEDWFWAPVMTDPPLIRLIEAYDGSHRLEHFAKANDILRVKAENEARAHQAAKARS